ncbi:MAG: hypothetical protein ACLU9T_18030 [Blautia faecis]
MVISVLAGHWRSRTRRLLHGAKLQACGCHRDFNRDFLWRRGWIFSWKPYHADLQHVYGAGPWTPWQMFAFGMIGFLAGILYQKGILKARKFDLCIYGFLSVFLIYGGIMNPASILMS